MKFVYVVSIRQFNNERIVGIYERKEDATIQVHNCALRNYGIDLTREPLDFNGALIRYGWADKVWWEKFIVY